MTTVLQMALGVWLGGIGLFLTMVVAVVIEDRIGVIKRRRRMGFSWRDALAI